MISSLLGKNVIEGLPEVAVDLQNKTSSAALFRF